MPSDGGCAYDCCERALRAAFVGWPLFGTVVLFYSTWAFHIAHRGRTLPRQMEIDTAGSVMLLLGVNTPEVLAP